MNSETWQGLVAVSVAFSYLTLCFVWLVVLPVVGLLWVCGLLR